MGYKGVLKLLADEVVFVINVLVWGEIQGADNESLERCCMHLINYAFT